MYAYFPKKRHVMIISFFGHSSYVYTIEDENRLLKMIEEVANGQSVDFHLGGYGDFDVLAKHCANQYKQKHIGSKLVFVTPYINEWLDSRKEYIRENYDETIYPELENVPLRYAISKRNEWIIRQSDYIFMFVKTHFGGAYKALIYAEKHKKKYANVFNGDFELY